MKLEFTLLLGFQKKDNTNMKSFLFALLIFVATTGGYAQTPAFQGQAPISEKVDTRNHAIVLQWRGTYTFGDVKFDNNFEGARLNGITQDNDTLFTAIITAENYLINPSPWYAFKVTSATPRTFWVHLTYLNAKHRYYPKISRDGKTWQPVDSADCRLEKDSTKTPRTFQDNALSKSAYIRIRADSRPLWIAAQELVTSKEVKVWMKKLTKKSFVSKEIIGKSLENRPMPCLRIGEDKADSKMMVVIGRLHPPEVTGDFALQSFVETLCSDTGVAQQFRKHYTVYVIPTVNLDGVANGHWRHNAGGIDLNRDWLDFNQRETQLVRDFLTKKLKNTNRKLYFGIDFHSTWDDIFYTNTTQKPTNMEGFIQEWFKSLEQSIPNYKVNTRPSSTVNGVVSKAYFSREFNAEALVYEVGDNTPQAFTVFKARVAAEKLMSLSLEYLKK
jgi:cytosolic carboxypeptidase protein 6